MYVRLIKPSWAKPNLGKKANPDFKKEVFGPNVIEGNLSDAEIKLKNNAGYNAYFFPNDASFIPQDQAFVSGDNIDQFNLVFVDMDLKDGVYPSKQDFLQKLPEKFKLEPSLVVDSGNGIHCYWKVTDLDKFSYMELQLRLIQLLETDVSVWTPLQLMRLPGTLNTKVFENFKLAEVLKASDKSYTVSEINTQLPEITKENLRKIEEHLNRAAGISELTSFEFTDYDDLPTKFQVILDNDDKKDQHLRDLFLEPQKTKGDRSSADMRLAHILYSHKNFNKKELMQVMLNTEKARSRSGVHRLNYAAGITIKMIESIVDAKYDVCSVAESKDKGTIRDLGDLVYGPSFFDYHVLGDPWRKREVLGMIAGPGIGKTSVSLKIFYDMIKNNPQNDDVFVFFSLEMTSEEIIARWQTLTGNDKSLDHRFYVISNETPEGDIRHISLQDIVKFSESIKRKTGCAIGAIAIDHVGVLNPLIDLDVDPNFGAEYLTEGKGRKRSMSIEVICAKVKELAKYLDTFVILQSQTTKDKAKGGDVPLNTNAAFGTARFEWYVDYVMTLWQPLYRVQSQCPLTALAWQYAKIRKKSARDIIKTGQHNILIYDLDSGDINLPREDELTIINHWQKEAQKIRNMQEQDKGVPEFKLSDLRRIVERNK